MDESSLDSKVSKPTSHEVLSASERVVKRLDKIAYNEREKSPDDTTRARIIGPTWNAFIELQPDNITTPPSERAANQLIGLRDTFIKDAEKAIDQGIHNDLNSAEIDKETKLETALRREIRASWDTKLTVEQQNAITQARDKETRRQRMRMEKDKMSMPIKVSKFKMLADTLWAIRDIGDKDNK